MDTSGFPVPSSDQVRKRLAAAIAESRYLRRLLQIAKEADEAKRLRKESKQAREVGHAK